MPPLAMMAASTLFFPPPGSLDCLRFPSRDLLRRRFCSGDLLLLFDNVLLRTGDRLARLPH